MKTIAYFLAALIACLAHSQFATSATAASLTIGVNGPAHQVLVPGSPQGTFLTVTLTASAEEDILMNALPLVLSITDSAAPSSLSNLRLFDGSTALNTGANTLNPTGVGTNSITFDYSFIIPKGTTKILVLKGNVSTTATGVYHWQVGTGTTVTGFPSGRNADTVIGDTSSTTIIYGSSDSGLRFSAFKPQFGGQSVIYQAKGQPYHPFSIYTSTNLINWTRRTSLTFGANGQFDLWDMPANTSKQFYKAVTEWPSKLHISMDPNSPQGKVATGGTANVTMAIYTCRANYEAIRLDRIGLRLTQGSAGDLVRVTVWDGTTQIGSTVFVGGNVYAVCTFTSPLLIPKDGERILTIKADIENISFIGGYGVVGPSGHVIAIDYDDSNLQRTSGTGMESGETVTASGTTSVAGVRIYKSLPVCEIVPQNASGMADGVLCRVKISADIAGDISLAKLSFFLQGTSVSISDVSLFGYEDAGFSQPIGSFSTIGGKVAVAADTNTLVFAADSSSSIGGEKLSGRWLEMFIQNPNGSPGVISIPAGQSRYFVVRGTPQGVVSTSVLATTMKFDSPATDMSAIYPLIPDRSFIWSPNTLGTPDLNTSTDWSGSPGELLAPTVHQVRIP